MITIAVIYTKEKKDVPEGKRYSYNTNSDVKIGDLVTADTVKSNLQVVKVEDILYTHFDYTGFLYTENHPNAKGELKVIECTVIN